MVLFSKFRPILQTVLKPREQWQTSRKANERTIEMNENKCFSFQTMEFGTTNESNDNGIS